MKKTALIASMIVLAAVAATAQDYKGKARLFGYCYDEQGVPIEGVRVKLFSIKAQEGFEVTTDKTGRWAATWIRSGGWNIDFEKIGYAPKKIFAEVTDQKKNPDIVINLKKVVGLIVTDEIKDLLTKGNSLFEQKNIGEARAIYEQIVAKYPDAYPIYRNIGNCYFAQEQYDLAEQNYMKVLEKDAQNTDAIIAIGNCYTNRGDTAKALEWYGKVDFEKIDDPIVLYNLGTSYYGNAKFEEALKFFQKAVEKQKDFLDGIYQLGLAYISLNKKPEAIAAFEEYLKLDSESGRAGQVKGFLDYLKK